MSTRFSSSIKTSGSSGSVSKAFVHMSNKVNREVARLGLEVLKSMSPGGRIVTLTGKKIPRLAAELGEDDFNRYCAHPPILSLQKIYYCQRRLEELKKIASGSFESNKKELKDLTGEEVTTDEVQGVQKMRGLINHEYLVVEVQSSPTDKLYILAEKIGNKSKPGIYVEVAEPADYDKKNVVLHEIDCGGVAMKLDSLQSLLLDADTPDYNLKDHNCWDYATKATKRLLTECIAKVSGDEAKRARLQKEHNDLEANLNSKNMINTWKKVVGWSTSRR